MGIEELERDYFNRRQRKGTDEQHRRKLAEMENRNNSDLKLYGMPIEFIESIVVIFSFVGIAYLLYISNVLFAGITIKAIGMSIFSIVVLVIMFTLVWTRNSIADIIEADIEDFKEQFNFEYTGEKITTSDQISFLMNLVMDIVKYWKVSWAIYAVIITILYIITCYIGPFLTVFLLLIILMVIGLKLSEISENSKRYLKGKTKEISADPPSVGVMTLFGKPFFNLILDAGTAIVYPGVIGFLPIEIHQEPYDLKRMSGFISKDNIQVTLDKVQVLYIPDISNIETFIEAKKQRGVEDILENKIFGKLREIIRADDFEVLLGKKGDIEEAIKKFLILEKEHSNFSEMRENGIKDGYSLGIKLYDFNIGSIETTDEYAKEMMKKQTEIKQQQAEETESRTEVIQANIFKKAFEDAGTPKSFEYCLQLVKDDKIAREGHSITPGLRSALSSLGPEIVAGIRELIEAASRK